ncbi:TetR/AcrR family transcriptional regulator [Pseudomonas fluorescens]|uniref:TetR/AcrR family transcriptional regulator n=1 Tax=Pseudomonas fluorescens TaxID=294 RepID=UPI001A9E784A|nr:TetR/AcrR family transcriptional regulator [Pseudomonas fluorescens]QTD30696.1 TetR/AcrR family transcriptional regulator [Pseudomonas fluorescens]
MARVGAELRRQDFVKAAVRVIAEHGVANATTRRIAAAAGSPLASLHYVFRTKDELFYAVYESLFALPQQSLEQVPVGSDPAETAAGMLRQIVDWLANNPELARAQSELFFWIMRNQPDMADKIYSVGLETTEQTLGRALGDRIDKTTLMEASRTLILLFDGLLIAWSAHGDLERLKQETNIACKALALLVANA